MMSINIADTLKLDESSHTYSLNGTLVPSVTGVIRHFAPSWRAGEYHLNKGRATHKAVELALRNRLDYSTLDKRIVVRLNSILRFIASAKLTVIETEKMMASKIYGFAGTMDCVAEYDDGMVILDWKSSVDEAAAVQLGAYGILARENGFKIKRAAAIICKDSEQFKAHWLNRRELDANGRLFLAFLTTWKWQKQTKRTETEQENHE